MNNAVHVEIQVVKFFAVGIGFRGVDRNLLAVHLAWDLFLDSSCHLGEFVGQPSKRGVNNRARKRRRDRHYLKKAGTPMVESCIQKKKREGIISMQCQHRHFVVGWTGFLIIIVFLGNLLLVYK